jgi:diamine N-acetyltransferase
MQISLRRLEKADAPLMLEWMHDADIQRSFQRDMMSATLQDAEDFCQNAVVPNVLHGGENIHFAIAGENGEYLGTVSLKNIDVKNKTAEYAIVTRKKAHRKGVAAQATKLVLKKAFEEYELHRVYLNVLENNQVAIRLYEKSGFSYEGEFKQHILKDGKYMNLRWYGMLEETFVGKLGGGNS